MKHVLLLTIVMLLGASLAFAQGGNIGLYSDPSGTDCNLAPILGVCDVFVVHTLAPGVLGSEWAITQPSCLNEPFISDTSPFGVYIGVSPFTGKTVGYGLCLGSPIHIATLSYFCELSTPPCCLQSVVPHTVTGNLGATDCAINTIPATGGTGIWNADSSCGCDVAAEETTWGGIKSLYR